MKRTFITFFMLAVISMAFGLKLHAQQTKTVERLPKAKTINSGQSIIHDKLIDRYFESLNETDEKRRRELIEQAWTENGIFVYPGSEIKGRAAISADALKVQKMYPGATVRRTSKVEVLENNYIRFNWEFGQPGGETLIKGVDFAVIADEKLQLVVGFFDFIRDTAKQ